VHSDLKPSNVLIKRTELGYTTKLIDFDSSYIVGNPPPPEDIVGTMNYYSPELVRYIQGSATPDELSEASDIFALGLIYAEYLTGSMPTFDPAHHEAAIAVLHGQPLKLGESRAPASVVELVERMLLPDPAARPSVAQVHSTLMSLRAGTPPGTTARAPVPIRPPVAPRRDVSAPTTSGAPIAGATPVPAERSGAASRLRGKGVRIGSSPGTEAPSPTTGEPAPSSRSVPAATTGPRPLAADPPLSASDTRRGHTLLGKLLHKLDERRPR
jgi:serine/threonine protein kinase